MTSPISSKDAQGSAHPVAVDRKSTRLNSSHLGISYAVFCLKKKKHTALLKLFRPLAWHIQSPNDNRRTLKGRPRRTYCSCRRIRIPPHFRTRRSKRRPTRSN